MLSSQQGKQQARLWISDTHRILSVAALELVLSTTSGAASGKNFINMMTFQFQYITPTWACFTSAIAIVSALGQWLITFAITIYASYYTRLHWKYYEVSIVSIFGKIAVRYWDYMSYLLLLFNTGAIKWDRIKRDSQGTSCSCGRQPSCFDV